MKAKQYMQLCLATVKQLFQCQGMRMRIYKTIKVNMPLMVLYIILKENSTVYSIPSKDYYRTKNAFVLYTTLDFQSK